MAAAGVMSHWQHTVHFTDESLKDRIRKKYWSSQPERMQRQDGALCRSLFLADQLIWDKEAHCSYDEAGYYIIAIQPMNIVTCPDCKEYQLHVLCMYKYSHQCYLGNVLQQPICYFCHPKTIKDIADMSQREKSSTSRKTRKADQQSELTEDS